ncbi:unnamed protein product [Symbiodinium sp. CCMP2592]|nr:unnamed protein product [Symbiodinium sp. CCMP2592]
MTTDRNYTGHSTHTLDKISEWLWADRSEGDAKEEIVAGHRCQQHGSREETYYASSFCYWLPEIHDTMRTMPLLKWRGGPYPKVLDMGKDVRYRRGKCVKAAVCHNNGQTDDGTVTSTSFAEEVAVREGCLGEREILSKCERSVEEANADLKSTVLVCDAVEKRHRKAVNDLNACLKSLAELPGQIQYTFPRRIREQDRLINRKRSDLSDAKSKRESAKSHILLTCSGFSLFSPPFCSYSLRKEDLHKYIRCNNCKRSHNKLSSAKRAESGAQSALRRAESDLRSLEAKLRGAEVRLQRCQKEIPSLENVKDSLDKEWLPQEKHCRVAAAEYQRKQQQFIPECARDHYDHSCEKSCLETSSGGCAVVEGNKDGASHVRGGVHVPCAPPEPSWILGPRRDAEQESLEKQCQRIVQVQHPQFAQSILKVGWLWRKGRVWGWDKHFTVFESADAVRSAVLRFYEDDPSSNQKTSASAPSIILWDAKGVKTKAGPHYGFKDGELCFKLYHFYTDYRFCVPSDVPGDKSAERAEWMDLLSSNMNFSDWK